MNSNHHQSGLTLISWIILISLFMFVIWFGIRLFPIYMEYYSINSTMNTVASHIEVGETPQQIRLSIDNLFTINEVDDVTPKDNVTIVPSQDGTGLILTLDYDSRTNFVGNVDLLVHFHRVYKANLH
ncbi:MAG TPA: DUF4845 domain-containing protein [Gammaproteobacteria bacterium]|nr:DUF4845 domain-containing protein [Gammaproteobacteria bacterium]